MAKVSGVSNQFPAHGGGNAAESFQSPMVINPNDPPKPENEQQKKTLATAIKTSNFLKAFGIGLIGVGVGAIVATVVTVNPVFAIVAAVSLIAGVVLLKLSSSEEVSRDIARRLEKKKAGYATAEEYDLASKDKNTSEIPGGVQIASLPKEEKTSILKHLNLEIQVLREEMPGCEIKWQVQKGPAGNLFLAVEVFGRKEAVGVGPVSVTPTTRFTTMTLLSKDDPSTIVHYTNIDSTSWGLISSGHNPWAHWES